MHAWRRVTDVFLLGGVSLPEDADSSTIHAVTYLKTAEILTVNSIGQLKMWDFRQQSSSPSQILSLYELFSLARRVLPLCKCRRTRRQSQSEGFSAGRGIASRSTVSTDTPTNSTLWPREGRTACSVSGT